MSTRAQLITLLLALGICLSGCGWITPAPPVPKDVLDIIHAVDAGDHAELERLLKAGATPTPAGSPLSPLHAAATHFGDGKLGCDSAALKLLLDHGADPNFVDPDSGESPLEEVLSFGDVGCARLLKAAGANINRHGKSGQSMLVFAVKGAVHVSDTSVVRLVLSWGANPNALDGDGTAYTALHEAANTTPGQDAGPVTIELLQAGADPCIVDRAGATAWDYVTGFKKVITEIPGQTALEIATNLEQKTSVQKFLTDAMSRCPPTGTGPYYGTPKVHP